jgi:transketolase
MVAKAKASHIGTCLSAADILAVLYGRVLRVDPAAPESPERDRFIFSKGHGAAILFAVLAERGFFGVGRLETFCRDGSPLIGHASHPVPGVELSTGSLGHGLSVGCGMALAAKSDGAGHRTFVLLSDGELDCGSCWEAALFARQHGLDNLAAIVDRNGLQAFGRTKDVLDLEPLAEKWRAFGWSASEIDGHDHEKITAALQAVPREPAKPTVVIARTVKGKGVSFMEDRLEWHYRSPNQQQLAQALEELGETA